MSFVRRTLPPPPPEQKPEKFPVKLCALAAFVVAGLFAFLVLAVPATDPDRSSAMSLAAAWMGKVSAKFPAILAVLLLASIVPAMVFRHEAKKYLIRHVLLFSLVWLWLFVVTMQPVARAAEMIRESLSMSREFPEVIQGREAESPKDASLEKLVPVQ